MDAPVTEVRPSDVIEILDVLSGSDIEAWVDGGWAVDALIGRQTRPHADLDIAVRTIDLVGAGETLTEHGFATVRNEGAHNVVFADATGRVVDVHAFDHTSRVKGEDGIMRHGGDGLAYEVDGFDGDGLIAERRVRCISPATLVRYHTGYAVDDDDWHDVRLLTERFSLPVPVDYERFER